MIKPIFFLIALLSSFLTIAQEKSTGFNHTYGGGGRDIAYSICDTQDGGMMVLGLSTSYGTGKDMYLLKLDKNGKIMWSQTYGGQKVDSGIRIKQTTDGNYIIIGNTTSFGAKRRDLFLLKIDQNGEQIWAHAYGGELNEFGIDVAETADGGFILAGETNSFDVKDHDVYVVKVDSLGDEEWSETIGGDSIEFASSIIPVKDGYIIGGETNSIGQGGYDALLFKLDLEGELIWSKVYGGPQDDHLNQLITDDSGDLIFLGSTTSFGFGGRDVLFVHTNGYGDPRMVQTLGGIGDEEPQEIRRLVDNGYAIVGFSNSFNDQLTGYDAYIIRMNDRYKMKWSKTFGGNLNDLGLGLLYHHDEFVVVGETVSFTSRGDKDIFAISIPDKRKIEQCELTNVQTVRIPIDKLITVNSAFFEEVKVESSQLDTEIEHHTVLTQYLIICEDDQFLIESNEPEEEGEN